MRNFVYSRARALGAVGSPALQKISRTLVPTSIAAAALAAPSRQPGRRQRVQSIVAATLLRVIDWWGGGAGASGSDESLGDDEIGLPVSGADPAPRRANPDGQSSVFADATDEKCLRLPPAWICGLPCLDVHCCL